MDQFYAIFHFCGNNTDFEGKRRWNQRDSTLWILMNSNKQFVNKYYIWYDVMDSQEKFIFSP